MSLPATRLTTNDTVDVAIIGAGPYALSLAAQLRPRGVRFRIFGFTMASWKAMNQSMSLKSPDFGTSIHVPEPRSGFVDYCRDHNISTAEPCVIAKFVGYGTWAQKQFVPEVEETRVVSLTRMAGGFGLLLATGEELSARRVVVAVGLTNFARVPKELGTFPGELVSHTSAHSEYSAYRGKKVMVLGAGQSALEAAALLNEAGADVELAVRGTGAYFANPPSPSRSLRDRLLYPASVLGPGRLNYFLQHAPMAMHYAPADRRVRLTRRHLGPWGAWWLRERVEGKFPIHTSTRVLSARAVDSQLSVRVGKVDAADRDIRVDHVVCGTGYEVDVARISFLDHELKTSIRRIEKAPALSRRFESSVAGLYFVGAASALSFGPLVRFVAGATFTAPTLARHLARGSNRAPGDIRQHQFAVARQLADEG